MPFSAQLRKIAALFRIAVEGFRLVLDVSPLPAVAHLSVNLFSRLSELAVLWATKLIVDRVTAHRLSEALTMVGFFVLAAAFRGALPRVGRSLEFYLSKRLPIHTAGILQEKVHAFRGIALFEDAAFHNALENARRNANLVGLVGLIGWVFSQSFYLVSVVLILGRYHPLAPLVVLAAAAPRAILRHRLEVREWSIQRSGAEEARKMAYFSEVVTGDEHAKEVRLFGLGPVFTSAYREAFSTLYGRLHRVRLRRTFWNALTALISAGGTGAVYVVLAGQAATGAVTIGDLVLYVGLLFSLHRNLVSASNMVGIGYRTLLDLSLFLDFLKLEPVLQYTKRPAKPAESSGLVFQGVTFFYPSAHRPALDRVSFALAQGETLALVGANGAGKTTIVKLLARLYDPAEGRILLNGVDLRDYDVDDLRQRLAVVMQDFVHYHLTVRENIGFGQVDRLEDEDRVRKAAELGQAEAVIARLPHELDTVLGREFPDGVEISGGEWQKVAISRGFMRAADVLVLDEPTAALDALAEQALYRAFAERVRGRSALFVSHRLSTVRMADRIVVLDGGKVSESGSHEMLVAKGGLYARLFAMQAERYMS